MNWDQYSASGRKKALSGRLPLIGIGLVAVLLIGGILVLAINMRPSGGPATIGPADAEQTANRPGRIPDSETAPPTTIPGPQEQMHPQATQAQIEAAYNRAVEFTTAWARPDLNQTQWLAGIRPMLVDGAEEGFKYTEPSNIPATQVNGAPRVISSSALDAIIGVPTDAGLMAVQVDLTETPPRVSTIERLNSR